MFPQAAGMRVVRVLVRQQAGDGQRLARSRGEGEDAAEGIFIDKKITRCESEAVFGKDAVIFKAIFAMQRAVNRAFLSAEIVRRDKDGLAYFETNVEMSGILKLVIDIAAQIRDVPTHSQRLQRTQHSAGIEFPGMIGIVQIAVWGKIVMRNHKKLRHGYPHAF